MPPLYMEAVEIDPVRDQDIEYARRTLLAGVNTELHVHPAVPHGFKPIAHDSAVAHRMMADRLRVIGALRRPQDEPVGWGRPRVFSRS
jgi:acetyl esterase/lipase